MEIQEHIHTALDFLARSDRYFAEGDRFQGSEKLWGAAAHAIMALSRQRGWRFSSHRYMCEAAEQVAKELNEPLIRSDFNIAEKFHANFYHDFMPNWRIEHARPRVRRFVHRVLSLPELNKTTA